MIRVGVIGSNGFIGRNLSSRLISMGFDVSAFYNTRKDFIPKECKLLNIEDTEYFNLDFDVVFITVGSFQSLYTERIKQLLEVSRLLDSINFRKLILISSTSVYGSHEESICVDSSYNCPSEYGQSKLAFEFITNRFPLVVTLRFTYVYGFGMHINSLIPRWIFSAKSQNEIIVFGDGSRKQDYLNIADAINYCLAALEIEERSVFLCATGKSLSNLELANIIRIHYPSCKLITQGSDVTYSQSFNIDRTSLILPDFIPLNEGITQLISDYEAINL